MIRRRLHSSVLGILAFLLPVVAVSADAVASDRPFFVEADRYRVELIAWERHGAGDASVRFRFRVQDKRSGEERAFVVENALTALERGEIAGNLLLLVGDVQGLATGLTLVDLERAEVGDLLLSYGGDISPDGAELVYLRFYPRSVPPEAQSDLVLALDLTVGSAERLARPIYPPEIDGGVLPRGWVREPAARHQVLRQAGFLWLEDPRRVVFVDVTEGAPWLVGVDLSRGTSEPRIERCRIEVAELLAATRGSEDYRRLLEQERQSLSVVGLREGVKGRVVIELVRDGRFKVPEVSTALAGVSRRQCRDPDRVGIGGQSLPL